MAPNVVTVLAGVRNDDGIGIILRLQKLYASTTMQDKLNAQEYLQNLQMHPRETISSFISRFHRAIQHIYDASSNPEPLPEIYLINLFLVKTLHAVPASSDIRSTLLDYQRLIQRARNLNDIPFTLADIDMKSAPRKTIQSP